MDGIDLNLLAALDTLLAEGSVTGAARRLGLSPSAMSRTLARLRDATGDPLLVQAGRRMVLTPHALELAERVPAVAREARELLSPRRGPLDLARLQRTFVLRTNAGFLERFGNDLVARICAAAPGVDLHFVPKPDKAPAPLRDGSIDLEIGVLGTDAPELRTQLLFRDRFVGTVRQGHALLGAETVAAADYVAYEHVVTSRHGRAHGPVDVALAKIGLTRRIRAVVPTHGDALRIARESDLVALVPASCLPSDEAVLHTFRLPVRSPPIRVLAIWHPRLDADPPHRWLREQVMALCHPNGAT